MTATDFNATPLIDLATLNESKALMENKFPKIAAYFIEDSALYITRIEEAFAANDAEAMVPPAHTLKSSCRQMGAMRLSAVAEYIEHTAREIVKGKGDIRPLGSAIAQLQGILHCVRDTYR